LLAIARRNAAPADKAWVSKMFETARAEALPIEILEANAFIVQESGASPFEAESGNLLGAESQEEGAAVSGAGAAGNRAPEALSGQQGAAGGRNWHALSGLRAAPMFLELDAHFREMNLRRSDSNAAGIIQMYRLGEAEERGEAAPVRVAGIRN
jgi:hypothetical protein